AERAGRHARARLRRLRAGGRLHGGRAADACRPRPLRAAARVHARAATAARAVLRDLGRVPRLDAVPGRALGLRPRRELAEGRSGRSDLLLTRYESSASAIGTATGVAPPRSATWY